MKKQLALLSALALFGASAPAAAIAQDVTGSIGGAVSGAVSGAADGLGLGASVGADVGVNADVDADRRDRGRLHDRSHGSLSIESRTDVDSHGNVELRRKHGSANVDADVSSATELDGSTNN